MPTLYLASTSPRRKSLLTEAGIEFALIVPGPEGSEPGPPDQQAMLRARAKALGVPEPPAGLILGADTVVDLDGQELGKPADRDAARAMLARLSDRTHRVHTGHCIWHKARGETATALTTAQVCCGPIAADELESYLERGTWSDKAGAYGIQDPGASFLKLVKGDLDTVMGLSITAVRELLGQLRAQTGNGAP